MTAPRELLDQLDALHAAATPGPWDAEICEGELTVSAGSARTQWTDHDGFRTGIAPSSYRSTDRIYEHDLDDWDGSTTADDRQREADADLIVAAVNALPKLTAALRAVLTLASDLDSYVAARGRPATGSYDDGVNRAQAAVAADIRVALTAALSPAEPQSGNPA